MKTRVASTHRLLPLAALALLSFFLFRPGTPTRPPQLPACDSRLPLEPVVCNDQQIQDACAKHCSMTSMCGPQTAECGYTADVYNHPSATTYDCTCDCMPGSTCVSGACVPSSSLDMAATGGDMATSMNGGDMAMSSSDMMAMAMLCPGAITEEDKNGGGFGFSASGTQKYVVVGTINGSSTAALSGSIQFYKLTVGQMVKVSLVSLPACGTTGCDATMSVSDGTTTVSSPGGNCGSATFTAQDLGAQFGGTVQLTITAGAPNEGILLEPL